MKFLLALLLIIAVPSVGCVNSKPPSAEVTAYSTIKATDDAVLTSLKVWANRYAKRESENEKTKAIDLSGYMERKAMLIQEEARVRQLQANYTAAVTLAVQTWVAARNSGTASTASPVATPDVLKAAAAIESISK